jgi:hypothetical protein
MYGLHPSTSTPNRIQCFRNWIFFHPWVKRWEVIIQLGLLEMANLNHWIDDGQSQRTQ